MTFVKVVPVTPENITAVHLLIEEDHRVTYQFIQSTLNISVKAE